MTAKLTPTEIIKQVANTTQPTKKERRDKRPLNEQEQQYIICSYESGKSTTQIARKLDRTDGVVSRFLKRTGVPARVPLGQCSQFKTKVIEDFESGLTRNDIAAKHGVNKQIVSGILRKAGHGETVRHLTEQDKAFIIAEYETGKDTYQVGDLTGFSSVTVSKVVIAAGVNRGPFKFTDEQQANIATRYQAGETLEELAEALYVSPTCIVGVLKRLKIKRRSMFVSDQQRQFIIEKYEEGKEIKLISKEIGVDVGTIGSIARSAGLPMRREHKIPAIGDQVIRLYSSGKTAQQVAQEFGLSSGAVSFFLKKQDISRPPKQANRKRAIENLAEHEHCYVFRRRLFDKVRRNVLYRDWRKAVLERDKYTCQICGSTKQIRADHIYPLSALFYDYKIASLKQALECELLWRVDNGQAICFTCDRKSDTYGAKARRFQKRQTAAPTLIASELQSPTPHV